MDTGDTIFREWDLYDRIGRGNYMRHREVSTALRDALRDRAGPLQVLDLGCGDGWMADQVLAGSVVAGYVGVDLSASALDRLSRRPCPGIQPGSVERRVVCGDVAAEVSALAGLQFDVVLAGYVLHHFPTDAKATLLDDIARRVAPGGWFLWTDLVRSADDSRTDLIDRIADDIHANWSTLSPDEQRSAIEHMELFDFPETDVWMIEQVERRGLASVRWLFRDASFGTLRSARPA